MPPEIILILNTLTSREVAVMVWLLIFILWSLSKKELRQSAIELIRTLFQGQLLIIFGTMFIYIALILWGLYKMHLWNILHIKEVIFWIFGSAIILLMKINKVTHEENYFQEILRDNLKVVLIIEFIVTTYTFNFWVELLFVPTIFFIIALSAMSGIKKEYSPIKKGLDFTLSLIGLCLIGFAVLQIMSNMNGFWNLNNLQSFILPPLLTLTFIPFLYIWAIFMTYEMLFIRVDAFLKQNKDLAKFTKIKIFQSFFLNLKKLNAFQKENAIHLLQVQNEEDALNLIRRN